jgi:hypothetical protein
MTRATVSASSVISRLTLSDKRFMVADFIA